MKQELTRLRKEVKLQHIVIVDDQGRPRIELGTEPEGTSLAMFDKQGQVRTILGVHDQGGPMVSLRDKSGTERVGVRLQPDGPFISLRDEEDVMRTSVAVTNGQPGLLLFDDTETLRGWFGLGMDLQGRKGAGLGIADNAGQVRTLLGVTDEKPWMGIINEEGKAVWNPPVSMEQQSASNSDIHVVPGKYRTYYHIRFRLTPENCELSVPVSERQPKYSDTNEYSFSEGGQFEVFVRKADFPIPSPYPDREFLILRMPWTNPSESNAEQFISAKRKLFERIRKMKEEGGEPVEVTIELNPYVKVLSEDPLTVELEQRNIFFRQAYGQYIDYVGELKDEDIPRSD
ncbi:MAG: hypothetical protein ACOC0A_04525 [Planctomycetota bacterium]